MDHYVTMNYLVMTPQQHLRCHRHLRYHKLNSLHVQQESETFQVTVEGKKLIYLCQLNPGTLTEAVTCPEKVEWIQAMEKEMESLYENELSPERKAIGSKWVYEIKKGADG